MRQLLPLAALIVATPLAAQQATTSGDLREAYGIPLDQTSVPAVSRGVTTRLQTRINNRINNRLELRLQRYNFILNDPVAAYRRPQTDGSRDGVAIDPLPAVAQ